MVLEHPGLDTDVYEIAEPRADSMILSTRAIGYDLPTAVADIIDNSITAEAKNIWLIFEWNGEDSWISIADDGIGMSEEELSNAMRLGSCSPLIERTPRDLGRFGLGLKTASFSQCKRLTVMTKQQGGVASARCWDLDYVTSCCQWRLLKSISEKSESRLTFFNQTKKGTVVLWECLDKIVDGNQTENTQQRERFFQRVEQVEFHISMVFHKFMERPKGIKIWINGQRVNPWNPFLFYKDSPTQGLPDEMITYRNHSITVKPYVLPHQRWLATKEFVNAGGLRGWNDMQGFYVYRNSRMLVAGDWLGLNIQKEEHCKLARIELNIPSSLDMDWQIDVKKSRARPPSELRPALKRIAAATRTRATTVYRHRGKVISSPDQDIQFLWNTTSNHGHVKNIINRSHPAIKSIKNICGDDLWKHVDALLKLIEENLPGSYTHITDLGIGPKDELDDNGGVLEVARGIYDMYIASGISSDNAIQLLSVTSPFDKFLEVVALLEERIHNP